MIRHDAHLTQEQLKMLPLFQGQEENDLAWMLDFCHTLEIGPDTVILSPESWNEALYLILDGTVTVETDNQHSLKITELGPGHCVGEMSIINQSHPSALVKTRTPCTLLMIDSGIIDSLISRSHIIVRNLLEMLCQRLRSNTMELAETHKLKQHYHDHANFDALTGVQNRRWLENNLQTIINRSLLEDEPLSVLMLDLDNFKQYNDRFGHPAADQALKSSIDAVAACLRENDMVARYGGEEFVVLLNNTDIDAATVTAQRICDTIRDTRINDTSGNPLAPVTVSIGIAAHDSDHDMHSLLNQADKAMYRAKQSGRDQVSR